MPTAITAGRPAIVVARPVGPAGPAGPVGPVGPAGPGGGNFIQAGTGAVTRTMQDKVRERVSVKDFGALGDGVNDDTAEIQACIDAVALVGGTVFFPPGKYMVSATLNLNKSSATTEENLTRVNLMGSGKGNTQLQFTATAGPLLNFITNPLNNSYRAYCTIEHIRFMGVPALNTAGLQVTGAAFLTVRDCTFNTFDFGVLAYDCISTQFYNCMFFANNQGLMAKHQSFSPPNALTFTGCTFAGNRDYGVMLYQPSTCTFTGGSFENNGVNAAANGFGIAIIADNSPPASLIGPMAAVFNGVYFEHNGTLADLYFIGGGTPGPTSVVVQGCMFDRVSGAAGQFCTNNINMNVQATTSKLSLTVIGCGFRGFNDYVPSAARPYINVPSVVGSTWDVTLLGNIYDSPLERPNILGPTKTGKAMASAWVRFNGTTGALIAGHNIASVSRLSTGNYTITFQKPVPGTFAGICWAGAVNGPGIVGLVAESATAHTFKTYNNAATDTDFACVSIMFFGGGEII